MKGGSCMGKSERWEHLKPADLERMSTAGLEKLLLQDFQDPESSEDRMEQLYYAAQLLAERTPDSNVSADRAWADFQEKYLPFAEAHSARYEDGAVPSSYADLGRRRSHFRKWSVRGMLAAAALALLLLSVSVAAAASGRGLWELLARWTDEVISIAPGQVTRIDPDEIRIPEEGTEYASLQDALDDCGLTLPVAPNWVPEGLELIELIVDTNDPNSLVFVSCYHGNDTVLLINLHIFLTRDDGGNGGYGDFQKDEGDPIPYEAGGITHLLSTNAGRPIALWVNGPVEGSIIGDITMDELKQIIDSIYE